ncbi:hypothetical protein [Aminobacter sp. AP02]|uniref:hypothetical protein n=1 Tax=Aminobacter sp. AP02 TaxID=2135737 RepID=UPI0011B1CBDA|nr:hypothetical protein [Aminobacter sp. AP02]
MKKAATDRNKIGAAFSFFYRSGGKRWLHQRLQAQYPVAHAPRQGQGALTAFVDCTFGANPACPMRPRERKQCI